MPVNLTTKTIDLLTGEGWACERVESANHRVKFDPFGFDLMAVRPGRTMGVQVTSASHASNRRAKLQSNPKTRAWLDAGNEAMLRTWWKRGNSKKWVIHKREVIR